MPSKWYERKLKSGRLTVYNGAGAWSKHVTQAMSDFSGLSFKVVLDTDADKNKADIVVMLSNGKSNSFSWGGNVIKSDFDAAGTHGQAGSFLDSRGRVEKVVIFLPEKLKGVSDDIKVLVVIHELIHACGLSEKNDHDPVGGVLYKKLQLVYGKLIEPTTDKKLLGMPPVRVGTWTQGKMAELWTIEDKKKN